LIATQYSNGTTLSQIVRMPGLLSATLPYRLMRGGTLICDRGNTFADAGLSSSIENLASI
jgi:hypothetical protein